MTHKRIKVPTEDQIRGYTNCPECDKVLKVNLNQRTGCATLVAHKPPKVAK